MFDNIADQDRMKFVFARDGYEGAMLFAKQCVHQYKGAVLASKRKNKRQGVFRKAYIRSYLFHKQYVKENSMTDDMLFQRGHILTRIDRNTDDFDVIITDHYFEKVLELNGEVTDANGSEYHLNSLANDNFDITFTVAETMFEADDGEMYKFEELVVQCLGTVIQEEDEADILNVTDYFVLSVK